MLRRSFPALLCLSFIWGGHPSASAANTSRYDALVTAHFEREFAHDPIGATDVGRHDFDDALPDFSAAGHAAWRTELHKDLAAFQALDSKGFALETRDDLELLIASIQAQLLEEEKIQRWRINPDLPVGAMTDGIFGLMKRNFAPAEARLRSVIARERQIPAALTAATTVLVEPAAIYTEIAQKQIDGNIAFFKNDVPAAFAGVTDPTLQKRFAHANAGVIAALGRYKQFLKTIKPKSTAPFALGTENYQAKLRFEEMVDMPVDKILAVGMTRLRQDQAALVEAAREIDPKRSVDQVVADIGHDHVAADQLIPTAQKQLDSLRRFIIDHKIATIPPDSRSPKVAETPPFMRATTFASMDTPGPLEKTAREAYYFITLPDPRWNAAKREEYLQGYNTPLLQNVSVHEVWPGHYVQYLYMVEDPKRSLVRNLINAGTTVEGWAHYDEQMMLDEGLGNGDPKLRLTQLQDALLRDCRLVVGIRLHTQGMTIEEARRFFVTEGHQAAVNGEVEAYRGSEDPTYLIYTLGKLGILKLRDDYKAMKGEAFSLEEFHDRFNAAGTIPLKLIRRELMGKDGPLL
jgi:uncharacterized protein (DUF885 family)